MGKVTTLCVLPVTLVILCILYVESAYIYEDENWLPQRHTGCIFGDKIFKVGETWTYRGKCAQYKCRAKDTLTVIPCPKMQFSGPLTCKMIPGDNSKPFPRCCPTPQCGYAWPNELDVEQPPSSQEDDQWDGQPQPQYPPQTPPAGDDDDVEEILPPEYDY